MEAPDPSPPLTEWLAAALGLVLVVATLGFLVHAGWTGNEAPPDPRLRLVQVIEQPPGRWLARVEIRNAGDRPAAALRVKGELRQGGEAVEASDVELEYLPGRSRREAGLFFGRDPRTFQLELRAESYRQP